MLSMEWPSPSQTLLKQETIVHTDYEYLESVLVGCLILLVFIYCMVVMFKDCASNRAAAVTPAPAVAPEPVLAVAPEAAPVVEAAPEEGI